MYFLARRYVTGEGVWTKKKKYTYTYIYRNACVCTQVRAGAFYGFPPFAKNCLYCGSGVDTTRQSREKSVARNDRHVVVAAKV